VLAQSSAGESQLRLRGKHLSASHAGFVESARGLAFGTPALNERIHSKTQKDQ
jgi:hypothetical protein